MISLCWSSELHPATETAETADDSQREGLSVVQEQSCPTWYRETEYDGDINMISILVKNFPTTLMIAHFGIHYHLVSNSFYKLSMFLNIQL